SLPRGVSFRPTACLTSLAIGLHAQGYALALLFFGVCFLFHGRLIIRSGFLPKVLGILIQVAGLCYVTNSLAQFLAPAFEDRIFPAILLPCFIAEASLALWLLAKGVNVEQWKQMNRLRSPAFPPSSRRATAESPVRCDRADVRRQQPGTLIELLHGPPLRPPARRPPQGCALLPGRRDGSLERRNASGRTAHSSHSSSGRASHSLSHRHRR